MNHLNGKRAVLYARSAAQLHQDDQYTLPNLRVMEMRKYAERMNLEIVGEFVDEDFPVLQQNRPQLQKMLECVTKSQCNVLIVPDLVRLAQSWQQIPDLLHTLRQSDVTLISLADPEIEYDVPMFERLTVVNPAESEKRIRREYRHKTSDLPG
jgi:DNA invertase Pin-like site-specific DNA recombinase